MERKNNERYFCFPDEEKAQAFIAVAEGSNIYANRVQGQIEVHVNIESLDRAAAIALRDLAAKHGGQRCG
jgi:hypothetical protein